MRAVYRRKAVAPRTLTIGWPRKLADSSTRFWADQIVAGLRANGTRIERREIPQPPMTPFHLLLAEVDDAEDTHTIAFDLNDEAEIDETVAANALVYFKLQYTEAGYAFANVAPGGYIVANNLAYRYLPLLRAMRSQQRFSYDVYGRFGLRYGGAEIRRRAFELLSAREDFEFEGSLFRYPGGPDDYPYKRYLFEIPRAKVCVDLPGLGDLCTRLIEYLAVGACVVSPPADVRLPMRLVDGVHIVRCAPDLSDLGDICADLVRDDEERERIARNGRDFFDRYLHRRQLVAYYLAEVIHAAARNAHPVSRRVPAAPQRIALDEALASSIGNVKAPRMPRLPFRRLTAAMAVLLVVLVGLPELLGDQPYDPRPSTWVRTVEDP